ncbi:DnaJ domain-containing protein [Vibrio vulnificus]|nr:DnaJ domain-containing protein [Vibrio vulnificus]EHY1122015.1 DnaJ domain-containing protein [Vibrio vulnificus]
MKELVLTLSMLANAGLIGYLYYVRKQNSAPNTTIDNVEKSAQDNPQSGINETVLETSNTACDAADNSYFKTEKDKLFFLLNEVDGKRRNQLLGITTDMYSDEKLSKQWFKRISNKVHPDKNPNDPRATEAFDNLKKLYSMMTL